MKVLQPIPFSTYQAQIANQNSQKMKFNWRANWEILLVLVIIVVGIVITTIAAIKNKDKHLLTLPEETDFGQLLASSGLSEANNSLAQQTDLQFTSDLDDPHPTRKPQVKSPRSSAHPSVRDQQVNSNNDQRGASAVQTGGRQSKFDDNTADYGRPGNTDQQLASAMPAQTNAGGHDSYDALSTEPTPSQIRTTETVGGAYSSGNVHQQRNHSSNHHHNHHHHQHPNGRPHFSGSRRHLNRTSNTNQLNDDGQLVMQSPYTDPLGDPADLIDDIHTTRSSLANSNEAYHNKGSNMANGAQADQLPLSLQAPYGTMQANSLNQLNQILMHSSNSKLDPSSSLIDGDDLIGGPYSRLHSTNGANNSSTNSLTDAFLRDFNLASAISNANSNQSNNHHLLTSAMLANLIGSQSVDSSAAADPFSQQQQQQSNGATSTANNHHRGYPSWPISVLLTDLLKLTARPAQQLSNALTGSSGDQSNRGSILQQSRLPGPLLSLIQGFSQGSGANHELASMPNHDASESNQYYHRVPIASTDIHSILARSLGSSSVLPAYPAPKGTPQTWIPPTQGGSIDYGSATSRNADLIANNVAGFVRNSGNQQQLNNNNDQSAHQYNPQQHDSYQRSSNDPGFFSQAGDTGQVNGQPQQTQTSFGAANVDQQIPPIEQSRHASNQQTMYPSNSPPQQLVSNTDRQWFSNPSAGTGSLVGGSFPVGGNGRQVSVIQQPNDVDNRQAAFKQANQQNTLLPQQDYNNYMNPFHQAQNLAAQAGAVGLQPALFNLAPNSINTNTGQQQVAHHKFAASQNTFNQGSMFNNNQPQSEMPVPLGYNPALNGAGLSSQSQLTAQPRFFEHASAESSVTKMNPSNNVQISSPVAVAAAAAAAAVGGVGVGASAIANKQQPQSRQLSKQQVVINQHNQLNQGATKAHGLRRRKRAVVSHTREDMGREDEVMSSKYNANDDEDDGDSRPISVVRPDGRPMNSGRVRGFPALANQGEEIRNGKNSASVASDRQVAQSQRSANHLDLTQRLPSHNNRFLSSLYGDNQNNQVPELNQFAQIRENDQDNLILNESGNFIGQQSSQRDKDAKRIFNGIKKYNNKNSLDTAGTGLMSKLLSTASTNDEMEDDMDDDEDPASEKRKEELEDAEFGIVNDERQNRPAPDRPTSNGRPLDHGLHNSEDGKLSPLRSVESGNSGSGSTDNEAYARRNQQRSDIEFYGHPGEETRQLKYGILGSGNYEVVNGGIYPEADESTAAVNSVANYVRKPILANLPKLLAGQPVNPQSAFMPGGRVGGFLRGDSASSSDELAGIMPGDIGKHLTSPLLELIDANTGEQLFDPNLLAQLGSSGSSARTTHATRDSGNSQSNDEEQIENGDTPDRKQRNNSIDNPKKSSQNGEAGRINQSDYRRNKKNHKKTLEKGLHDERLAGFNEETDDNSDDQSQTTKNKITIKEPNELRSNHLERQQSSISGSRSQGTNQFNSYQILPSKKVTIFSDQDLDSAPSEQLDARTHRHPGIVDIRRLRSKNQLLI